jgi:hypothetical protein
MSMLISSCVETLFNAEDLHGNWTVQSWTLQNSNRAINNKMDMSFKDDGTYEIDYGTESENGKYWIQGEFLHTIETGAREKKVKILKLAPGAFEMQMNRGGELENVVFSVIE